MEELSLWILLLEGFWHLVVDLVLKKVNLIERPKQIDSQDLLLNHLFMHWH